MAKLFGFIPLPSSEYSLTGSWVNKSTANNRVRDLPKSMIASEIVYATLTKNPYYVSSFREQLPGARTNYRQFFTSIKRLERSLKSSKERIAKGFYWNLRGDTNSVSPNFISREEFDKKVETSQDKLDNLLFPLVQSQFKSQWTTTGYKPKLDIGLFNIHNEEVALTTPQFNKLISHLNYENGRIKYNQTTQYVGRRHKDYFIKDDRSASGLSYRKQYYEHTVTFYYPERFIPKHEDDEPRYKTIYNHPLSTPNNPIKVIGEVFLDNDDLNITPGMEITDDDIEEFSEKYGEMEDTDSIPLIIAQHEVSIPNSVVIVLDKLITREVEERNSYIANEGSDNHERYVDYTITKGYTEVKISHDKTPINEWIYNDGGVSYISIPPGSDIERKFLSIRQELKDKTDEYNNQYSYTPSGSRDIKLTLAWSVSALKPNGAIWVPSYNTDKLPERNGKSDKELAEANSKEIDRTKGRDRHSNTNSKEAEPTNSRTTNNRSKLSANEAIERSKYKRASRRTKFHDSNTLTRYINGAYSSLGINPLRDFRKAEDSLNEAKRSSSSSNATYHRGYYYTTFAVNMSNTSQPNQCYWYYFMKYWHKHYGTGSTNLYYENGYCKYRLSFQIKEVHKAISLGSNIRALCKNKTRKNKFRNFYIVVPSNGGSLDSLVTDFEDSANPNSNRTLFIRTKNGLTGDIIVVENMISTATNTCRVGGNNSNKHSINGGSIHTEANKVLCTGFKHNAGNEQEISNYWEMELGDTLSNKFSAVDTFLFPIALEVMNTIPYYEANIISSQCFVNSAFNVGWNKLPWYMSKGMRFWLTIIPFLIEIWSIIEALRASGGNPFTWAGLKIILKEMAKRFIPQLVSSFVCGKLRAGNLVSNGRGDTRLQSLLGATMNVFSSLICRILVNAIAVAVAGGGSISLWDAVVQAFKSEFSRGWALVGEIAVSTGQEYFASVVQNKDYQRYLEAERWKNEYKKHMKKMKEMQDFLHKDVAMDLVSEKFRKGLDDLVNISKNLDDNGSDGYRKMLMILDVFKGLSNAKISDK